MDIKNLILSNMPEGSMDELVKMTGVDTDTVDKIMDAGMPEVIEQGMKTEGGLFDNLENKIITAAVVEKTGLDEGVVASVLDKILPFIKERIDSKELMTIIGGLSNGFGMDDIQNIAGAVMSGNDSKKENQDISGVEDKKTGFLGGILGGLFEKK